MKKTEKKKTEAKKIVEIRIEDLRLVAGGQVPNVYGRRGYPAPFGIE